VLVSGSSRSPSGNPGRNGGASRTPSAACNPPAVCNGPCLLRTLTPG